MLSIEMFHTNYRFNLKAEIFAQIVDLLAINSVPLSTRIFSG